MVWDQEVVGSNPATPTESHCKSSGFFCLCTQPTFYSVKGVSKYYVGQTNDPSDRLRRHNAGESVSTKNAVSRELVCSKEFNSRSEAIKMEKRIMGRGAKRFLDDYSVRQSA
ncbi:MAG: GIY-YIG nuclease family protein [Bacteroidia bacterium]